MGLKLNVVRRRIVICGSANMRLGTAGRGNNRRGSKWRVITSKESWEIFDHKEVREILRSQVAYFKLERGRKEDGGFMK
mgnify:CR=1 FL=1